MFSFDYLHKFIAASSIFHTVTTQQSTPDSVHTSLSHVQSGEPCPTAFPKDNVHCKPVSPLGGNGLTKTDFPSASSQNKSADPTEGNLIVLLHDFYYGQHIGDGEQEPKTHTAFKCRSCLKVLKNVEFMNHMKHHLELERLRDVDAHFRAYHSNTKNLLCPFCLQIFKTATLYICHYRQHWAKSFHQCSKCWLQFLTCKEKREHNTQCHQMFKKPKQLEGLPPETKVVIQVSLEPLQPGLVEVASITVNASDSEPSPPKSKSRRPKKPG
ncbi:hypothetical protein E5288_WYG009433 [Bos mutus]|uniref:C2H2-type domain-containing protein n=1 Tax=Bos mutus TaxID=72004 RepID=A0A6B0SH48_9CETA|nr:hypothetical protein [Bos mutus]